MTGFGHFKRNEPCKDDVALLMKESFLNFAATFSEKNSLFAYAPCHGIIYSFCSEGGLEITGDLN